MLTLAIKTLSLVVTLSLEVGQPNVSAMIICVMIIALAVEQKHSESSIFYYTLQFFFRVFGEFGSINMLYFIDLLQQVTMKMFFSVFQIITDFIL